MGDQIGTVEELNLGYARMTSRSLNELPSFNGLRVLRVSSVRLDRDIIEKLGDMTHLEELYISDMGSLNSVTLGFLSNLSNLKTLAMNNSNISDESFEALLPLDNLERLEFGETQVTGKGFSECRKRKKLGDLKYINANNSRFGDYGFVGIKNLDKLETLLVRKAVVD